VSGPGFTLRRAGPADAPALAAVGTATFLETFAGVLPGADILAFCAGEHSQALYAGWLAAGHPLWLAEAHAGAPVGYLALKPPELPIPVDADDLEVKRIYAFSRWHGSGLGRALIEAAADEARAQGKRRLLLGVYGGNGRAIAFYRKSGFEAVGERRFTVGAGTYDDLVMARTL
jgi:ribosomal protein S18 acetylase RimI-like enzyme